MCDQIGREKNSQQTTPNEIYHYTSPNGLIGILSNGPKLWFTRFDCLNDADEGKTISYDYARIMKDLLERNEIDQSFYDRFNSIEVRHIYEFNKISLDKRIMYYTKDHQIIDTLKWRLCTPYICCFSCNYDSLPMWNYYSKNGKYEGYNIGFTKWDIPSLENIVSGKVIYDDVSKKQILEGIIMDAYEQKDKKNESEIYNDLSQLLSRWSLFFKNIVFQHEEEYRIVIFIPNEAEYGVLNGASEHQIIYRLKDGIIIPYLQLQLRKNQVNSVTIGPLIKTDIAKKTLQQFMVANGYNGFVVRHSNVPIRY